MKRKTKNRIFCAIGVVVAIVYVLIISEWAKYGLCLGSYTAAALICAMYFVSIWLIIRFIYEKFIRHE